MKDANCVEDSDSVASGTQSQAAAWRCHSFIIAGLLWASSVPPAAHPKTSTIVPSLA